MYSLSEKKLHNKNLSLVKQELILNNYPLNFIEKYLKNYRNKLKLNIQNPNNPKTKPFDFQQCFTFLHIQYFTKELNKFLIKK